MSFYVYFNECIICVKWHGSLPPLKKMHECTSCKNQWVYQCDLTVVLLQFFDEPTADAHITSTNQHEALRLRAALSATESSQ